MAMNLTPPSSDTLPKPLYRRLDAPYWCFVGILAALCFGPLLWILPISQGDREGFAMLLGVPLMFGAFILGIVGLVLASIHWQEWPLAAMAFAGILFLLSWNLDDPGMEIAAAAYVVLISYFCARWFFFRRKRMKQAEDQ